MRTPKLAEEMSKLEFEQLKDGSFSSQYPTLGEGLRYGNDLWIK